MTCRCSPALLQLRTQVNARWPDRDKASDGCCGDAAHAARHSDHNPDAAGYAHAYDIDENIAPGLGDAPLTFLVPLLLADSRAKYVIYEARIYYAECTTHGRACFDRGGHPYHGLNAHTHHLHLSIKPGATYDIRPWPIDSQQQPQEDDDLTPEQAKLLLDIEQRLGNIEAALATGNDNAGKPRGPVGAVVAETNDRTARQGLDLGKIKKALNIPETP